MAQSFHPITPVDITPGTDDAWTDVDITAHCEGATVTGAILHIEVSATAAQDVGWRKNGSTDAHVEESAADQHWWCMIGVDGNDVFEMYVDDQNEVTVWLVGYTTAGVTFFTNAYDKTPGAAWTDMDYSSEAPNAIGLIFSVFDTWDGGTGYQWGVRKNGSTDSRNNYSGVCGAIIGCDGSQITEAYSSHGNLNIYCVGYVTDGATFDTNGTEVSPGVGSYSDLAALDNGGAMGIYEVHGVNTWTPAYKSGLRKNGTAEDIYRDCGGKHHIFAIVESDGSGLIEGKTENGDLDFFYIGETEVAAGGISIPVAMHHYTKNMRAG